VLFLLFFSAQTGIFAIYRRTCPYTTVVQYFGSSGRDFFRNQENLGWGEATAGSGRYADEAGGSSAVRQARRPDRTPT
jgi:hypothetical protein